METNKLVAGVVAAAISIIVLAAVLMPVLSDATKTTDTFTNEGYYRMSETEEESVIVWDTATDPDILTVNGKEMKLSEMGLSNMSSYSIAFGDDFIMRYYPQGSNSNIQFWVGSYTGQGTSASTGLVLTVTINTSGITIQKTGSSDATVTHTGKYFVIDPAGDMIMKKSNVPAYLLEDSSVIYAGGINNYASGSPGGMYFEGKIGDYTFTPMRANVEVTNSDTTYSQVSDHIGLDLLEKITFTTTWTKTDQTTETIDQTYSYFLVPYQVTAEKAQHLSDGMNAMLNVIPIMIIIAVLLGVIGLYMIRRE